jgi:GNAT superfamily N-acetyltransferase
VSPSVFSINPFIPQDASERDWAAFNRFLNRIQAEALPDDPMVPVEVTRRSWTGIPPIIKRKTWVVRDHTEGKIIAYGYCEMLQTEENQHLSINSIAVLPEMRLKGIGAHVLSILARSTQEHDRKLMLFEVNDRIPAGIKFAERLGASASLAAQVSQLKVADIDRQLLSDWQRRAAQRASGYELGLWGMPYPEQELPGIAAIKAAMNQAPTGDLDVEDVNYTPEFLQQIDASFIQRGGDRWTIYARETSTGSLAGYTEILWMPSKPGIGLQGDTAVLERYRNLGLGRWLKATMLEKVLHEKPDVKFIRTSNAESNAPMLKINQELGFLPYHSSSVCQVETARVVAYLTAKGIRLDPELSSIAVS